MADKAASLSRSVSGFIAPAEAANRSSPRRIDRGDNAFNQRNVRSISRSEPRDWAGDCRAIYGESPRRERAAVRVLIGDADTADTFPGMNRGARVVSQGYRPL